MLVSCMAVVPGLQTLPLLHRGDGAPERQGGGGRGVVPEVPKGIAPTANHRTVCDNRFANFAGSCSCFVHLPFGDVPYRAGERLTRTFDRMPAAVMIVSSRRRSPEEHAA